MLVSLSQGVQLGVGPIECSKLTGLRKGPRRPLRLPHLEEAIDLFSADLLRMQHLAYPVSETMIRASEETRTSEMYLAQDGGMTLLTSAAAMIVPV